MGWPYRLHGLSIGVEIPNIYVVAQPTAEPGIEADGEASIVTIKARRQGPRTFRVIDDLPRIHLNGEACRMQSW